jgi:hypothetical protein
MPTCFVIQPFDSGKFDKRFKETFAPAIVAAGFEPYRVDEDPHADVPITSIEDGIRSAAVCLADITMDNPNVWFELGFAFAANRPVVMVCSNERTGKYPFDIQHRAIIPYKTEAQSDFQTLSDAILERLKAAGERGQTLQRIAEAEPIAPVSGLSQIELSVLAVAAAAALPRTGFSLWGLQNDAEKIGLSKIGISLALRRLMQKQFLEDATVEDQNGEYKGAAVSSKGWDWIDANEDNFVLRRPAVRSTSTARFDQLPQSGGDDYAQSAEISDDDIPF